jgi:hypothetical protein
MPQPFLPAFQDRRYDIGFQSLEARPQFEAAIGRCITLWSYVDNELGGLFGVLLGTETQAAHRVFLILRRWSNQRQALDAAAESALTGNELSTYKALMVEYGSLETQRNDLAHGCFGICPDDEDMLFMVKVEHHVLWQATIIPQLSAGMHVGHPHQGLRERMWVYRMADLDRLHAQMKQLWWDMFYFNGYLRERENPGRIAEFQNLHTSPRIQQRITALG